MTVGCELLDGLERRSSAASSFLSRSLKKVTGSAPLAVIVATAFSRSIVRLFFEPGFRSPRFLR